MSKIFNKLFAVYLKHDNPKKNTVVKLARFGLVKLVRKLSFIPKKALILDPFAERILTPYDRDFIEKFGLAVIDCSWNKINSVFNRKFRTGRRLPNLLASNPINYGKWNKLSSAEALAAALFITGFDEEARELLSKFTWGHTFIELNLSLIEEYRNDPESINEEGSEMSDPVNGRDSYSDAESGI